jgi:hypothetical protein
MCKENTEIKQMLFEQQKDHQNHLKNQILS